MLIPYENTICDLTEQNFSPKNQNIIENTDKKLAENISSSDSENFESRDLDE